MKTLILLLLSSTFVFAADQPSIRQRRVVLELDGISTNQSLTTPTVPSIANGSLVKQDSGLVAAGEGTDYLGPARISDTAYGAGWNGDTANSASKNAIYDILNTFSAVSDEAYNEATWNGVTTVAPSKNAVRDAIQALVLSGFVGNADQFGIDSGGSVVITNGALVTNLVSQSTLKLGTTAGDPMWKASGTNVQARLADDSGYTKIQARDIEATEGDVQISTAGSVVFDGLNYFNSPTTSVWKLSVPSVADATMALIFGNDSDTDQYVITFDTGVMALLDGPQTGYQDFTAGVITAESFVGSSFEATGATPGALRLGDGGSEHFRIAPPDMTTSINYIPPPAAFTGLQKFVASATTNWTGSAAVAGTDYGVPSDVAYDATTWNANTDVPTKNAVRDKVESMVAGYSLAAYGAGHSPADGGTLYFGAFYGTTPTATYTNAQFRIPKTGTLKKLFVHSRVAGTLDSAANNVTFAAFINGTTAAGSVTLPYSTAANYGSDTSINQAVTEGDFVAVRQVSPTYTVDPTSVHVHALMWIEFAP